MVATLPDPLGGKGSWELRAAEVAAGALHVGFSDGHLAHLDLAGPCMNDAEGWRLWAARSATGSPVRSLVQFAETYK